MKFLGFKRKDGSVGVRNHVLILPSCACASETCRVVASQVLVLTTSSLMSAALMSLPIQK